MKIYQSWTFWLFIILFILFILWLLSSRKKYDFIGLRPLVPDIDTSKYDDHMLIHLDDMYTTQMNNSKNICPIIPKDNISICRKKSTINKKSSNTMKLHYIPFYAKKYNESKGEALCRKILTDIYKKPFLKVRPAFLKNPETGRNLELDGYNKELQIAFEYNGIQHYIYPNWIHKNKKDFMGQIRRDQYKIKVCNHLNIYLITIPYKISHNKIYNYIINHLPENIGHFYSSI